jgi:hypothetical protein
MGTKGAESNGQRGLAVRREKKRSASFPCRTPPQGGPQGGNPAPASNPPTERPRNPAQRSRIGAQTASAWFIPRGLLAAAMLLPVSGLGKSEQGFLFSPLEGPGPLSGGTSGTAPNSPGQPGAKTNPAGPGAREKNPASYVRAPWSAKTSPHFWVRLHNEQAEIRAGGSTHFELAPVHHPPPSSNPAPLPPFAPPTVVGSALKAQAARTLLPTQACASVRLHQGVLCLVKKHAPRTPTVLVAKTVSTECILATAQTCISCDAWGNTRISVYEGEVHVHPTLRPSFVLRAGHTVHIEASLPPSQGLLSDSPEGLAQRQIFDALALARPRPGLALDGRFSSTPTPVPPLTPDAVGGGSLVPFDLKSRRQSILLSPPSPEVSTPQDVSPEKPLPQ